MSRNEPTTINTKTQLIVASWCEEMGLRCLLEELVGGYSLDIYLPELRLGIELDGPHHSRKRDGKRDAFLERRHDIDVWRFKNKEVEKMNKEAFFEMIEERAGVMYED